MLELVYFPAQNSVGLVSSQNRESGRKVQDRTGLALTLGDDVDSFL
jgi:hypothetical protein